jgi:hypothetical protein
LFLQTGMFHRKVCVIRITVPQKIIDHRKTLHH